MSDWDMIFQTNLILLKSIQVSQSYVSPNITSFIAVFILLQFDARGLRSFWRNITLYKNLGQFLQNCFI